MLPKTVNTRCQYRDCKNVRSDEIKLFHFPAKTDPRYEVWITNCGNGPSLKKWTASSIRRAGICFEHFWPEAFWDNTRKKLRPQQNPIPYAPAEQKEMDDIRDIGQKKKDTETRMEEENIEIEIKEEKFENGTKEDTEVRMEDENKNIAGNKGAEKTATGTVYVLDKVTRPLSDTFHTEECELRVDKAKVLKTYSSAVKDKLRISCLDEETDQMDFSKMEPPLHNTSLDTQKKCTLSTYLNIENIKNLTKKYKKLKNDDERVLIKMKRKILILQQKLKAVRALQKREMTALKKKKFSISEFLDAYHCTNPASRAIVTLQLRQGQRPFNADELDLAKKMYHCSAPMYRYLRKAGIKLPAPSSIRHILAVEKLSVEQKPTLE